MNFRGLRTPYLRHALASAPLALLAGGAALVIVAACSSSTSSGGETADSGPAVDPPADSGATTDAPTGDDAGAELLPGCTQDPGAPAVTVDPDSATDPEGDASQFTLAKALDGFPAGSGKLTAAIRTELGDITCELAETAAPLSVANFVGLARGTRPFKNKTGKWTTGHFFDGLTFHRVIPDFVIQGGDPDGLGTGGPGYDMVVENQVAEPLGTLAMAASSTVSGSQFYIVVGTGPAPNYNVFGSCDTENAIAIAAVPTGANDKPKTPVHMLKVAIGRCP